MMPSLDDASDFVRACNIKEKRDEARGACSKTNQIPPTCTSESTYKGPFSQYVPSRRRTFFSSHGNIPQTLYLDVFLVHNHLGLVIGAFFCLLSSFIIITFTHCLPCKLN